jgi:hypothetical protein
MGWSEEQAERGMAGHFIPRLRLDALRDFEQKRNRAEP